jgi:hypothetical protein
MPEDYIHNKKSPSATLKGFQVTPKVQMSNSFIEDVKKIVALKFQIKSG